MVAAATPSPPLSTARVLLVGAAVVTLSMGIRHGFGLWLQPMTLERGRSRATFGFALAVQNLARGRVRPRRQLSGPALGGRPGKARPGLLLLMQR